MYWRLFSFIGLAATSGLTQLHADTSHVELGYRCDSPNDKIELRYFYYENGTEILQKEDVGAGGYETFQPERLLTYSKDEKRPSVLKKESVTRLCKLKAGTYKTIITPLPGNEYNLLGECGLSLTFTVSITKPPWYAIKEPKIYASEDGDVLLSPHGLEDTCRTAVPMITKNITFESALDKVTIVQVNSLSMYRPLKE